MQIDVHVFKVINQVWTNGLFNKVMPWVTDWRNTWWVFVILAVIWILAQRMKAVKVILGCALAVALSDSINHRVLKPLIKRDRPEVALGAAQVRLLVPSSHNYGFPSNHASNSFAVATYISFIQPALAIVVYPLAWLISYSRIYVGVHFPFDVIAGALFGVIYAVIARRIIVAIAVMIGARKTRDN